MAITASIKIKGYVQGYGAGRMEIDTTPLTDTSAHPATRFGVIGGDNTITPPTQSSTSLVIISVDSTLNGSAKILKGVAGDTGIQIFAANQGGTFFFPFTGVSFVINSGGSTPEMEFRFI